MSKKQLTTATIILAIFIAGFLFFRPSVWQNRIESYLNNQLDKEGWTININRLSGHLMSTIHTNDISLVNKNGSSILLPKISTRIKIISLLKGEIQLSELNLSNAEIYLAIELEDTLDGEKQLNFFPEKIPLNIKNLHADGQLFLDRNDSSRVMHFLIDGSIKPNNSNMTIDLLKFELFSAEPRLDIVMNNIKGDLSSKKISIDVGKANINGLPLGGHFEYKLGTSQLLKGEISLFEYNIPSKIFSQLPLQPELSKISATFLFESDMKIFTGELEINNDLGLAMSGEFNLERKIDYFQLHSLGLSGNDATLNIKGMYENDGRFNGTIELAQLDISQWITRGNKTNLSGYILIDGDFIDNQISAIDMNVEISESYLFDNEPSSISGGISYRGFKLDITNPLTLTIGPSLVEVRGSSDFNKDSLDLNLLLTDASTFLINNFWSDSLSGGKATGSMSLYGPFKSLGINADLVINKFEYENISLSSFEFVGKVDNLNDFSDGFFKLKFGKGLWNGYGFENGTAQIVLSDTMIEVSSFELKNYDDYLQFNGSISKDTLMVLERFQIAYQGHYLINPRPITINYLNDRFIFNPFQIHVDDGIIDGFIKTNPLQGNLKFSNVTTDIMTLFESEYSEKIKGNLFGEIIISKNLDQKDISLDLTLKNGQLAKQSFDDFYISAFYSDGALHLDEMTLIDGQKTGFQITGRFPILSDTTKLIQINLQSNFKNIDLTFFTQFLPRWEPYVFGKFTGSFNMGGTTKNTQMDLVGNIEHAFFGSIPLGSVNSIGHYKSKKFTLTEFSSNWKGNYIKGEAILPIDFDFASTNFQKWVKDEQIIVKTNGYFNSMVFLSENISEVDSITGDISINLEISGEIDSLLRDGDILIKQGKIHTVLMDEPVSDIYLSAKINKNHMLIESFKGTLFDSNIKNPPESNLMLLGKIDLTKFLEPRYNIKAIGNDIFFRSLDGDIESYSDLEIEIMGKDTIDITGTITARNGTIYSEFSSEVTSESYDDKSRTSTNYNIRFPIKESFSIRNSQIDATILGEIVMNRENDSDWNYSGEIELMEGEIYYYLGDVFKNLRGTMTMDGQGFNPFLDLTASTKIGDAEINLGVYGSFDNPEWRFDSDKGYTESDILQLLTFNSRVAEEGFTTEGLGTQAQTILGAYLERQLERNFVKATGLQSSGILEDVEISGTSELIRPGQGEEFSISAKVNRNFSLSYQRSFSLEAAYKNKVGVEYKLNPNFSVIGNVDEKGQVHMKFRVRRVY